MVILRRVVLVCGWLLVSAPAWAQGSGWEVEVHGGGALVNNLGGGSGGVPPPGATFTTFLGLPSRHVSSWYVGDGPDVMNSVLAGLGVPDRITPMDPTLTSRIGERGNGGHFGFRVARALTPRFGAEFNVDVASAAVTLASGVLTSLQASSDSFRSAINGLLATGPFTNVSTTSTVATQDDEGRQVTVTGALTINLATQGRVIPYATVGGGVVSNGGDLPTTDINGAYSFTAFGVAPLSESDRVQVRYAADDNTPVGVVGGGVKAMLTANSGVRGDVRVHFGSHTVQTLLDANPGSVPDSNPLTQFVIATVTSPSLQFTNVPAGLDTTLSGNAIADFETFSADGLFRQVLVSIGYFWRF